MEKEIKLAIVGLDTSHSFEYAKRMQDPKCPPEQKVDGMRVLTCMKFVTPFQNAEGIAEREKQLVSLGIKVTSDFNETVKDCDAILIEINDGSLHLEYFEKCAGLGKPIFLDKPLADNFINGKKICAIAKDKKARIFSSSSLRFVPQLGEIAKQIPKPVFTNIYAPLGIAPSGGSIVWYGVHAFEMLERSMGTGAISIFTAKNPIGLSIVAEYPDKRMGVIELTVGAYVYGGLVRAHKKVIPYEVGLSRIYTDLLNEIKNFINGGDVPVPMEETLEIMSMLDSAERSLQSGKVEAVMR